MIIDIPQNALQTPILQRLGVSAATLLGDIGSIRVTLSAELSGQNGKP
jgi:hypothetical protein